MIKGLKLLNLLKENTKFVFYVIQAHESSLIILFQHFMDFRNNIAKDTRKKLELVSFSTWKLYSIISLTQLNFKNESLKIKRNVIQDVYNLMNLSFKCNILRWINNKLVEIMNEREIEKLLEYVSENSMINLIWEWISSMKL